MNGKNINRIYSYDKDDQFIDVVSIPDGTDCSDGSSNTSSKHKVKVTSKKYHVNAAKNLRKSDVSHQLNHNFENSNSSTPHKLTEFPVSFKEVTKNRNSSKRLTSCSRGKKKIVSTKRAVSSYQKADPHVQEHKSKTPFLKNYLRSNKQSVVRSVSLTDIRENESDESVLSSSVKNISALTPSRSEEFEKSISLNGQDNNFDLLKEFDFIWNSSSFYPWEKSSWSSPKNALISTAKLSKTSEPFLLKRKTYSRGILSLNDKESSSSENNKNDIKEDLNNECGTDESDVYYLSENSDLDVCENNSGSEVSRKKNISGISTSRLVVKQPIRVQYIDENTAQNKELLIYSSDFLENAYKEKGKSGSKTEIFENVLEQSTAYQGKLLRVIPDIKHFFNNIKRKDKCQKRDANTQVPKNESLETSKKKAIIPQRKVQNSPCERENLVTTEVKNKRKDSVLPHDNFVKSNRQKVCQKNNINKIDGAAQQSETKKFFSQRDLVLNSAREPIDIYIKGGDGKSEIGGCSKSRIALKRINVEEIIASSFRHYFQFFAKLGGRLKSGVVISKMNSHFWLRRSGIIYDEQSLVMADDCFNSIARRKLVLNISDYLQYISMIARRRRLFLVDVIQRLMNLNLQADGTKMPSDVEANQLEGELQSSSKLQKSGPQGKINNNTARLPGKKA